MQPNNYETTSDHSDSSLQQSTNSAARIQAFVDHLMDQSQELTNQLLELEIDLQELVEGSSQLTRTQQTKQDELEENIEAIAAQLNKTQQRIDVYNKQLCLLQGTNMRTQSESPGYTTRVSSKRLPSSLPYFRGSKSNAIQDPREFLQEFQIILEAEEIPSTRWRNALRTCLTISDAHWASEHTSDSNTWEEIKELFLERFVSPIMLQQYSNEFLEIRQTKYEDFLTYCDRFKRLLTILKIDETAVYGIRKFILGVYNPSLRAQISVRYSDFPDDSLSEVMKKSSILEAAFSLDGEDPKRSSSKKENERKWCDKHKFSSHSTNECRYMRRESSSSKNNSKVNDKAIDRRTPPIVTCYKCGKTGHYANKCNNPRQLKQNSFSPNVESNYIEAYQKSRRRKPVPFCSRFSAA